MGRLEAIRETSGKAKCDRCGFTFLVSELIEDEKTGLILDSKCVDQPSFLEEKQEQIRDNINHHFAT